MATCLCTRLVNFKLAFFNITFSSLRALLKINQLSIMIKLERLKVTFHLSNVAFLDRGDCTQTKNNFKDSMDILAGWNYPNFHIDILTKSSQVWYRNAVIFYTSVLLFLLTELLQNNIQLNFLLKVFLSIKNHKHSTFFFCASLLRPALKTLSFFDFFL